MKIECRNVGYCYEVPGDEWAIRGVDLTLAPGEKVAVAGPAGSGKTTLIQLLDALILPSEGEVFYDGRAVSDLSRHRELTAVRRRIGVLFQFPEHQFFQETAYDELVFALRNFGGQDEREIERRAEGLLDAFGMDLGHLRNVSPFRLSSGEKRKLALASALMMSPEVLILDEPTAGMDARGRRELTRVVDDLHDTTVVVVTHNLEDFLPLIHRVVGIAGGEKVVDVRRNELVDRLADLEGADIVPPLVLEIQHRLQRRGVLLEEHVWEMEHLVSMLEDRLEV